MIEFKTRKQLQHKKKKWNHSQLLQFVIFCEVFDIILLFKTILIFHKFIWQTCIGWYFMFGCGESLMFKVQSEITNLNIKNYIYIYIYMYN